MGFAFDVGCWTFSVRRSFSHSGRVAESGLRHSTRNRAWGNPPWVRIPPLPLALSKRASGQRVLCLDNIGIWRRLRHMIISMLPMGSNHSCIPFVNRQLPRFILFSYEHTFSVFCSSVFDFIQSAFNHGCPWAEFA